MRIYKRNRRYALRWMVLLWLVPFICACAGVGTIAKQERNELLLAEPGPMDVEAIVNETGVAIRAEDKDPLRETLTFSQEELIVDLFIDKENTAEVYVNEEGVAINWIEEDHLAHGQLSLMQEGIFQLLVEVVDSSGMVRQIQALPIMVDGKTPEIQAFLDGKAISELPAYIDHEAQLKWEIRDAFFDAQTSVITDHGQVQPIRWEQQVSHWEGCMMLHSGAHQLAVSGMDMAGHQQIWTGATMVDCERPLVVMEYVAQSAYRDPFTVSFLIKDENVAEDNDMITLSCDGKKRSLHVDWHEAEQGIRGKFTVADSGRCSLVFHIQDQAGHIAAYETASGVQDDGFQHDFLLDQINPQIEIETDTEFSNQPLELALHLTDDHLDRKSLQVVVMRDEHEIDIPFTWEQQGEEWTGKAVFQQDGNYRLRIEAADEAGNLLCDKNHCGEIIYEFTVDQEAPQIQLRQSSTGQYRNESTQLTFAVSDRRLASYRLVILRDQMVSAVRSGNTDDALSLTLEQDGEYEIVGYAADQAGNVNQIQEHFIIDRTPPQLQAYFNDVPAKAGQTFISNRDVLLHMTWQDPYLATRQLRVLKNNEEMPIKTTAQGMMVTIPAESDREDRYQIEVQLSDWAGNETKALYQLRVDTYIPPLQFIEDPFQGKPRNLVWQPRLQQEDEAFHVNDVILYRNGQLVNNFHWGDSIIAEGSYLLTLSVRDEAMNEAVLLPPFAFTIDRTPPVIRVLEAQRQAELLDQRVSIASELRLYIQDTWSEVNIHTLIFDDRSLKIEERIQDEQGNWYYPLHFDRTGDVTLQVDVSDEADNHTAQTMVFHVSDQLKQSDVKIIESKVAAPQEQNSYRVVVLGGLVVSLLFAYGIKKIYAAN